MTENRPIQETLDIIKLKSTHITNELNKRDLTRTEQIKHFSPEIKEWNDSVYSYNKNTLNRIPTTHKIIIKLIKSYFNFFSNKLEYRRKHLLFNKKKRRLSSHKIYINKGEFKHTNDRITINLYVYNRQNRNYLSRIKKFKKLNREPLSKHKIVKIFKLKKKAYLKKIKYIFKEKRKEIFSSKLTKIEKEKLWANLLNYIKSKDLKRIFFRSVIKNIRAQRLAIYYRRLFLFNVLKFKYIYLNKLTNVIKRICNKNIEFNIINLKYFYLNSDIFTESITNKITKNRKKLYRILKKSVQKVKISNKSWMKNSNKISNENTLSLHNFIKSNTIKPFLFNFNKRDNISDLLYNIFNRYIRVNNTLKKIVISSIFNKTISGVRLETAGRLTKRYTASRSLHKLKYKGSLKNKYSSYKGLSSMLLIGNRKVNLQYTKLGSVARIGSFGVKGWISNN